MADTEIDSFIQKFKLLRGSGIEATLNFETKLGEVYISLNCKVGRNLPPPLSKSPPVVSNNKHRSPSYIRRQIRRDAERKAKCDNVKVSSVAVKATDEELVDKVETSANREMDEVSVVPSDENVSDEDDEIAREIAVASNDNISSDEDDDEDDDEAEEDALSHELANLIKKSQENRNLCGPFNDLPP